MITSPARKKQRLSLGTETEVALHSARAASPFERNGTPSNTQSASQGSQTEHGRRARMLAITNALTVGSPALSNESVAVPRSVSASEAASHIPNHQPRSSFAQLPTLLSVIQTHTSGSTALGDAVTSASSSQAVAHNVNSEHYGDNNKPLIDVLALEHSGFMKASSSALLDTSLDQQYDVGGSDDFDMDDDLFLGEPLPPLISRSLDISEQPTNGSKVTDPVSFVTTSTGLPGWTSASSRSGGALVPSAASLANAQKMLAGWNDDPDDDGDASLSAADTNFVGFSSASNKSIMPSAAALASAERKRKQWESDLLSCSDQEEEEGVEPPHSSLAADGEKSEMPSTTSFVGGNACTVIPSTPFKTPFKAPIIPHHAVPPVTAAPSGSMMSPFKSTASSSSLPFTPLADRVLSNSPALVFQGGKSRAFKSPLLLTTLNKASASPVPARSVYRPPNNSQSGHRPSQASMLASLRTDNAPLSTPERPSFPGSIHATSSQKPAHSKSMSSQRAPSFSTPFKNGMRPGEPGRVRLEEERDRSRQAARTHPASNLVSDMTFSTKGTTREDYRFFNLRTLSSRQSLASCGMRPQTYTEDELQGKGINVSELIQMTPNMAAFYSFHSSAYPSPAPSTTPISSSWGPAEALSELTRLGCTLATKAWVDNHWGLILWKLAGMVCLDPDAEADPHRRRWTWTHVMKQLLYRYERELQGGSRPPLRLITAQDAPSTSPIVLCISDIVWDAPSTSQGRRETRGPQIEVTDGWYKLRTELDEPLVRAVHSSRLRIGTKIVTSGARINSAKRDAAEVLEAYDSCSLKINGNSTHLAPWHTKLGYHDQVVSSLGSLTADGGFIAAMDLVVTKAHEVAYIEFVEDADGKKRREGPRNAKDEHQAEEVWKARKTAEVARLRDAMDKRIRTWQRHAERLERKRGPKFSPGADDVAPDNLEDLFDEIEESEDVSAIISRLSPHEAGWLARCIHDKCRKECDTFPEIVERDLKDVCLPREVRNFRVLFVEDARPHQKAEPARGQLTVWDVLSLSFAEGQRPGTFKEGQRFVVTNLLPSSPRSWVPKGKGSEIYLSTSRSSRWRPVS